MSMKELIFRVRWLWSAFWDWIYNVVTYRPPKGYGFKRIISWTLYRDDETIEHYEGTFWEFVKWIFTYETFDNL